MGRLLFLLAFWSLAISLGVLGYQSLTWYFYQEWPAVSVGFGWHEVRTGWAEMFGDVWFIPAHWRGPIPPGDLRDGLTWLAGRPLVPAGIILSYVLFLLSDVLRGRVARRGGEAV